MGLISGSPAANDAERRLRAMPRRDEIALEGHSSNPPTAGEITAAAGGAPSRRAARLAGWATSALERIGDQAAADAMRAQAEAASRGG